MMWERSSDSTARISLDTVIPAEAPVFASAEDHVIQLFDELHTPLLRYLASFGVMPPEGEEIVQDVFLSLFSHIQQGKPRQNLKAWVFRVARNLALRRYRSKKRKPEDLFGLNLLRHQELVDPRPNPEEHVINRNRHARLMATFHSFPEQVQQTLHLRSEGLRYVEIAEVLGVSLTTVAGIVSRSLEKLQKVYES